MSLSNSSFCSLGSIIKSAIKSTNPPAKFVSAPVNAEITSIVFSIANNGAFIKIKIPSKISRFLSAVWICILACSCCVFICVFLAAISVSSAFNFISNISFSVFPCSFKILLCLSIFSYVLLDASALALAALAISLSVSLIPVNPFSTDGIIFNNLSKFITINATAPATKNIGLVSNALPKFASAPPTSLKILPMSFAFKSPTADDTPFNPVTAAPKSSDIIDEPIIPKELFNLSNGSPANVLTPRLKSPTLSVSSPSCFCTLSNSAVPSGNLPNSSRSCFICALNDCAFCSPLPLISNSKTTLLSAIRISF